MKAILVGFVLLFLIGFTAQPVFSQNVNDGIVAYWAFNETAGETAADSSGNGHDGILEGDPQWVKDGYFGGALEFDQAGDEVNVPFHADLNQQEFTICAWANVDPESGNHRAVISSRHEPPLSGYIIYAEPGNTWQFWTGTGAPPWSVVRGPGINLGEWEHLAGVCSDGKQTLYVNGELAGETDAVVNVNAEQEFLIGAGANERATHQYLFNGKIDEVILYNRALSADEIAAVMERESLTAVQPVGKLAITWGQLKNR